MEYGNGKVNHLVWRKVENRYHHEESELTLDNPNVNISVLGNRILEGSSVLDVGCGEGKIGKLLTKRNCSIYGIEIDAVAIQYAKENSGYKDIYQFNVENPTINESEYKRFKDQNLIFDYIIIADVLEHTINPTKVIEEVSKYLKFDGEILISIPNVNNADIILNLLRGRFNYMEAGILDNTHTKYFTKSSFVEWIADMNTIFHDFKYDCQYIGGVYGLTDYMEEVKKEMPLVFEFMQLNPEYSIIQNLFVLTKRKDINELKYIDDLLEEKRVDLVKVLSDYFERGMDDKFVEKIGSIKMLPNERVILEERADVAEKGWKECDEKLSQSINEISALNCQIQSLNIECEKAREAIKQNDKKRKEAMEGWKNADKMYEDILESQKEKDIKYQEAMEGWKEADKRYEDILESQKEKDIKYQEAMEGWKKADKMYGDILESQKEKDIKYQEAMEGWKKVDKMYEDILESQKEKDIKYQEAMEGWKEADKRYQDVLEALKEKDAKYQEAMEGWIACDKQLQELQKKSEMSGEL